jgi:two-component system repressor protein LuxO
MDRDCALGEGVTVNELVHDVSVRRHGSPVRTIAPLSVPPRRPLTMVEPKDLPPRGNARRQVLIVEDSPTVSMLCTEYLKKAGFETGEECLAELEAAPPAAMLLDLGLPDMNGLDLLRRVKARGLPTSVVIITSNASLSSAIEAMRLGAFDYVVKPFRGERIATTVRNAVQNFALSKEVETYRKEIARPSFAALIGSSPQMQAVYRIIESAATSKATVFITGESGTGKELCASAIHTESARANGPFVAINCAAIPRELMESEIFGHVKGAFTHATADRPGAAMRANGGTLFLGEICEMGLDLQAKILRLTQSGSLQRVGSSTTWRRWTSGPSAPRTGIPGRRFRPAGFARTCTTASM